jgi:putative integral membrane protein (TIGR02587 family)
MEVWWAGFIARPSHLLLYFLVGFVLLFGYNRYAGLRQDASWREVAFEAVEEMGLGLLVAAGTLWLLGRLEASTQPAEILGMIVVEGVVAAIGVSVGSAQLGDEGGKGGGGRSQGMEGDEDKDGKPPSLTAQLVLATCGAVLFASNVAPTEEILMIAVETSPWKIVGLAVLSLFLAGVLLFQSDFRGARHATPDAHRGAFTFASQMVSIYGVALAASAFILWFFGRFDGMSLGVCAAQTVVLGVAAALGAAAGRLLLQR